MTIPYSRVTVAHGSRTVDLAMPNALPLSDVMPRLLNLCLPDQSAEQPQVWVLGRPGEVGLDPARTLADAGVSDGDVLELRTRADKTLPAYVEDVRDAVEDAVDGSGQQWRSATTAGFAIATGGVALAAAMLEPGVRQPRDGIALAAAVSVAAFLVPAAAWAAEKVHTALTLLVMTVACLWGGLAGWLVASWMDSDRPQWLAAAGAALLIAVGLRTITPLAIAHLAATVMLFAAAGCLAAVTESLDAARVLAVIAVALIGALPRTSLTLGGLAAADYQVRNSALLTQQMLIDRIRQSSWLLGGALTALATIGGLTGIVLAYEPGVWDRLLAGTVGLALVLRSRLFSRVPHVLPPRLAGLAVLSALALRHAAEAGAMLPWLGMITLLAFGLITVVSAMPVSDITRARAKQLLNWSEYIVMIAMVAFTAGALGIFDDVAARTG